MYRRGAAGARSSPEFASEQLHKSLDQNVRKLTLDAYMADHCRCDAVPAIQDSIYAVSCSAQFGSMQNTSIPYSSGGAGTGAYQAQLFSKMNNASGDFQTYCYHNWDVCARPQPIGIEEDLYFSSKPAKAHTAPLASGLNINAIHLSDWHLDPRYDIGSEANCSDYLCCRTYSTNSKLKTTSSNASVPASRFGEHDLSFLSSADPSRLPILRLTSRSGTQLFRQHAAILRHEERLVLHLHRRHRLA